MKAKKKKKTAARVKRSSSFSLNLNKSEKRRNPRGYFRKSRLGKILRMMIYFELLTINIQITKPSTVILHYFLFYFNIY